ncbi:MAG TPA: hypothetical protein VFF74_07345 [Methylophilaceae bacterium]|nr:hypothetical protein [Methylophilaceae bacterium]
MDNKYGLGSTKVAQEHHETHAKTHAKSELTCRFCGHAELTLSPTMHDHRCNHCGEWQNDIPMGYSTGRSSDY